jgi:hypothetical protein
VVGDNWGGDGHGVAGFTREDPGSGDVENLSTRFGVVGASNEGIGVVGLSITRVATGDHDEIVIPDKDTIDVAAFDLYSRAKDLIINTSFNAIAAQNVASSLSRTRTHGDGNDLTLTVVP